MIQFYGLVKILNCMLVIAESKKTLLFLKKASASRGYSSAIALSYF